MYSYTQKMTFGSDFLMPFEEVGKWGINKFNKVDKLADKSLDSAGSIMGGVADILSGNTNFFWYLGLGIVGIGVAWHVIPKLVDKVV